MKTAAEQRVFLHDISDELAKVHGHVDLAIEALEGASGVDPAVVGRLKKAMDSIGVIVEKIVVAREDIIASQGT